MPRSFPLRWKILSWFFVNLALIVLGIFLLFRAQFRVGIDSLLNGPTGDRLEALARPLAVELRTTPDRSKWPAVFERATEGWRARGLQAALIRNDGVLLTGEVPALPAEIRQAIENFDRRKRGGFGVGPNFWNRFSPRGPGPGQSPGGPGGSGRGGPPMEAGDWPGGGDFRRNRFPGDHSGFFGPGPPSELSPEGAQGTAGSGFGSGNPPGDKPPAAGPAKAPEAVKPEAPKLGGPGPQKGGELTFAPRMPQREDRRPGMDKRWFPFPPPEQGANPRSTAMTALSNAPLQKFMLVAGNPRIYWAGVHLDGTAITAREPAPLPVTLLLASPSLRGGGLFFDYLPWLILGGVLLAGSVLLWLPFVHRLTKALGGLTRNAEAIARGRFESPPISGRRDELGRLERAHRDMASRLDGFVTGQKRFLGDTAHELLSPVARLEVGLSILEQRVDVEDMKYVTRALEEVRQMSSLVRDLLSFTKAGLLHPSVKPQTLVLADVANEAVERETVDSGADVTVSIPGEIEVLAMPSLLSRAIGNVVRNAVRYAGADGPILLIAASRGAQVVLTISDQGAGVPEDALPRLFDPFFRPDTSRTQSTGGTGLGLAIVKTAVEACHGTVSVRNGSPHGLIVEMSLVPAQEAGGLPDGQASA
ncbi:MAG: HAMP domain-containing histidine kinase [Verrucomicrobiaceae bacterium]|nr:MAG: HAMP domain-containing histidine kinase [Verrucomicrobiaceae bacterium]